MNFLLKNGTVYTSNKFVKRDLVISGGKLSFFAPSDLSTYTVIDCDNLFILPGFVDAHVHLREPGFSYKETVLTGSTW